MKRWKRGLGLLILAALAIGPAQAARRYALVIGNSAYPGQPMEPGVWDQLPNATNDVILIADAFRADGFTDVLVKTDLTYQAFNKALDQFSNEVDGADLAVVYYAGHGFEYGRKNYLTPIDGPTSATTAELPNTFIDFEKVATVAAKARVNIFFLDACRTPVSFVKVSAAPAVVAPTVAATTPASTAARPMTRGLGVVEDEAMGFSDIDYPKDGNLAVVYSTARGEPALDGAPPPTNYSPFAWEVSKDIVVPHVDLGILFETIRADVIQHTKSSHPSQAPYTYASISPGFFIADAASPGVAAPAAALSPIRIDPHDLATVDEPVLIVRVLRDHPVGEIEALAEHGDAIATYLLGYMYEYGVGVPTDLVQARSWLERAAAQGTPYGELEYAAFLRQQTWDASNKMQALGLFQAAAAHGYAKAQAHLAETLMRGDLAPQTLDSYREGLDLMRQAADNGYPYAMFTLARWGRSASEKADNAAALRRLANGGDTDGSGWLCELAAGADDYPRAVPDCKVAARVGFATAQARLAIAYHRGAGVAQSDEDARHWGTMALSQSVLEKSLRDLLSFVN